MKFLKRLILPLFMLLSLIWCGCGARDKELVYQDASPLFESDMTEGDVLKAFGRPTFVRNIREGTDGSKLTRWSYFPIQRQSAAKSGEPVSGFEIYFIDKKTVTISELRMVGMEVK